jgi:hypothetical protein
MGLPRKTGNQHVDLPVQIYVLIDIGGACAPARGIRTRRRTPLRIEHEDTYHAGT